MLRTVHLHGHLADRFGKQPMEIDIVTPGEAVRALCALRTGFRDELRKGAYHVLVKHGERYFDVDEKELALQLGRSTEIHFVPVIEGSKRSGVLKVVLGVALVAGAFLMAPAALAGGLGATAIGVSGMGITYGQIAMIGIGLAVAGVSQLLAPQTKTPEEKDTSSYIIAPSENTVQQGVSVPIVIGRYMVGSVVMSVGIATEQIGTQGITYPGQG